jgi:hypothetical protein
VSVSRALSSQVRSVVQLTIVGLVAALAGPAGDALLGDRAVASVVVSGLGRSTALSPHIARSDSVSGLPRDPSGRLTA